uniref:Coronin n=1 Tax=Phallusia mammillata TaxID=59560 RepID=A0A6F9D9R0_9ASCI|nr:coronin-7-like [Phallusia mammillata]
MVKVWNLPSSGISGSLNPTQTFQCFRRRPELVKHHPVTNLVAVAAGNSFQVLDILAGTSNIDFTVECDLIQSASWSNDGKTIACTTKDKKLFVMDPRANSVVQQGKAHDNHKDSRIQCLGDTGKILTSGFNSSRQRQLKAWDERNMKSCLQSIELGSGSGVLMPFYDPDSRLIVIGGKGDSSLSIFEVTDAAECISKANQIMLPDQTKGMGMVPKLAVDVMSCEVTRLFQLCSKQLVPIRVEVPRKSHRDFASDLFPDTDSDEIVLTAEDWLNGKDAQRTKCSLDPAKRKPLAGEAPTSVTSTTQSVTSPTDNTKEDDAVAVKPQTAEKSKPAAKVQEPEKDSSPNGVAAAPVAKTFPGVRQCKFRHWTSTTMHPSTHVTNIQNLSKSLPGSCDGFHVNAKFAAVPLSTSGGHIAVIDVTKPGRISQPCSLQNTANPTDFKWNPFDNHQLAVGLDDGVVKIWNIQQSGLTETASEPDMELRAHYSKVVCLQFHPLARNILATASFDNKIIIWNLDTGNEEITLTGHEEEILHMAWSNDGKYLATVAKDAKIRVYMPRKSTTPSKVGPGPLGSRGARVVWACGDKILCVSGFEKSGKRRLGVHSVEKLSDKPLEVVELPQAPSTLIPYLDVENNTIFLTGKGDSTMFSYEVLTEEPYLVAMATASSDQPHQGFCFLPKTVCDVRKVEFARAWRLGKSNLEPVSFKIPRVKMEYFQDDLYPKTRVVDKPSMTADDWLEGSNDQLPSVNQRPSDMKPLSEAPKEAPKARKYESYDRDTYKTDEQKKEELVSAMSNKLDLDKELEQDTMEGVDEDEWDDY